MAEKHYNAAGTHVLVHNPATDGRWECPEAYLPTALKLGWEFAEPVDEDADEAPAPQKRTRKSSKSGD